MSENHNYTTTGLGGGGDVDGFGNDNACCCFVSRPDFYSHHNRMQCIFRWVFVRAIKVEPLLCHRHRRHFPDPFVAPPAPTMILRGNLWPVEFWGFNEARHNEDAVKI